MARFLSFEEHGVEIWLNTDHIRSVEKPLKSAVGKICCVDGRIYEIPEEVYHEFVKWISQHPPENLS